MEKKRPKNVAVSADAKASAARGRITLKQLAEACGVSVGTVSQCLRNPENVRYSEKTRRMIQEKAQELNYIPNGIAAGLREGKTKNLGVVIPWNTPELMDGAVLEAKQHGYTLSIHFTYSPDADAELNALRRVITQRLDGLLWLAPNAVMTKSYAWAIEQLRQSSIQTVFFNHALADMPEAGVVAMDDRDSFQRVLDGFRKSKCSKIICISGRKHTVAMRRIKLLEEKFRKIGISTETIVAGDSLDFSAFAKKVGKKFKRTGVIALNDHVGVDVVKYARQAGLRMPEDIQLVTFGDMLIGGRHRIGEVSWPTMTAVQHPYGEMARSAVRILIESIESGQGTQGKVVKFPSVYVKRETTFS